MHCFSVLLLLVAASISALAAEPRKFSSRDTRTHLLELYTSEGCSSCPPAEEWLGTLQRHPGLWRDFVPVAFHVNYWDRLGWRDRFACQEFTQREQAYARAWGSGTVYTPCFVLDGSDQRNRVASPALAASDEKAGILTAACSDNGAVRVDYAAVDGGNYEVHAALLGGGITSSVRAGENSGRTLRHEFVALVHGSAGLRNGTAEIRLTPADTKGVTRRAMAVWVTRLGELAPVQATGGWLD